MSNNNHMPWLQRVIEDHQGKALWKDVIRHQQVDMIVFFFITILNFNALNKYRYLYACQAPCFFFE